MGTGTTPSSTRRAKAVAVCASLYSTWVVATYLLEGYPRTLLRSEATDLRVTYAAVANLAVGIVGGARVVRALGRAGVLTAAQAGFRGAAHTLAAVAAGTAVGFVAYWAQGPADVSAAVVINAFAQVLVVSAAEVVVCRAVVGCAIESLLRAWGRPVGVAGGLVAASAAFGVYHFAHSPPFNSLRTVAFLTGVGCATGLFFFISRDVYGTIAFHNFLALAGVVRVIQASGHTESYERLQPPLLWMAVGAGVVLVAVRLLGLGPIRSGARAAGGHPPPTEGQR
jgi:hypothetical protein